MIEWNIDGIDRRGLQRPFLPRSDIAAGSSVPLPCLIFLNRCAAIKKRFAEIANDISDLFYGNFATVQVCC
jgi:hypothetical protein